MCRARSPAGAGWAGPGGSSCGAGRPATGGRHRRGDGDGDGLGRRASHRRMARATRPPQARRQAADLAAAVLDRSRSAGPAAPAGRGWAHPSPRACRRPRIPVARGYGWCGMIMSVVDSAGVLGRTARTEMRRGRRLGPGRGRAESRRPAHRPRPPLVSPESAPPTPSADLAPSPSKSARSASSKLPLNSVSPPTRSITGSLTARSPPGEVRANAGASRGIPTPRRSTDARSPPRFG